MIPFHKKILTGLLLLILAAAFAGCDFFTTASTSSTTQPTTTSTTTTTTSSSASTTTEPPTTTTTTTTPTTESTVTTTTTLTTTITESVLTTTAEACDILSLVVTPPVLTTYDLDAVLDLSGMVVTFFLNDQSVILTEDQYSISSVNMSTEGEKIVTVSFLGLTDSFLIVVGEVLEITMAYYLSASGLSGQDLFLELRDIVNAGFDGVTYGDARYMLDDTDADPSISGNVILIYNGASVSGVWDSGITWNREHIWPQSLLGVAAENNLTNAASDLHNLKPSNPSINSSRGNKYFDVATTTLSYLPRPEDQGDIARILLYMVVMYDEYTLVNTTPNTYQMAKLSVLLQWCVSDPVDDFERARNNEIYSLQNNRNPFIDYPDFVNMIWG